MNNENGTFEVYYGNGQLNTNGITKMDRADGELKVGFDGSWKR